MMLRIDASRPPGVSISTMTAPHSPSALTMPPTIIGLAMYFSRRASSSSWVSGNSSRSSRMSSTLLLLAPSISTRSGLLPCAISVHEVHVPQGWAVGPSAQLRARARARAAVVLPTPRAPVNRKAWWMRPEERAFSRVRVTCSCPTISSKVAGRYLRAIAR